jgi:hypothetical protein
LLCRGIIFSGEKETYMIIICDEIIRKEEEEEK